MRLLRHMYLGIDIGTSKAAAVILDGRGEVIGLGSRTCAASPSARLGRHEQDPEELLQTAWRVVRELSDSARQAVRSIGVTGQMHGVVCCGRDALPAGPLITWQDQRTTEEPGFLTQLASVSGHPLAPGFGAATLAWLVAHNDLPAGATQAGTIADLAVARLVADPVLRTDPTNAASWGLFDLASLQWDTQAIERLALSVNLFPPILPCGAVAGSLSNAEAARLGLPAGVPVLVAMGDNQASLVATIDQPETQLALTLGTGGQAAAILAPGFPLDASHLAASEIRPFPGGRYLLVAASLCGGSAWRWLADLLNGFLSDFGAVPIPEETLFQKLNELGQAARAGHGLTVHPHFLGERHDPALRGSIAGIDFDNLSAGTLALALAQGVFENLRSMLPAFAMHGKTLLVGSGNAFRRNPLLVSAAQAAFGLPMRLSGGREEAATGAALLAAGRLP